MNACQALIAAQRKAEGMQLVLPFLEYFPQTLAHICLDLQQMSRPFAA